MLSLWEPQHLTTLWASTVCYRDSFTLLSLSLSLLPMHSLVLPFHLIISGTIRCAGTRIAQLV
jgi:hypothetical protein